MQIFMEIVMQNRKNYPRNSFARHKRKAPKIRDNKAQHKPPKKQIPLFVITFSAIGGIFLGVIGISALLNSEPKRTRLHQKTVQKTVQKTPPKKTQQPLWQIQIKKREENSQDLEKNGKVNKAIVVIKELLTLRKKHLGEDHDDYIRTYERLGNLYGKSLDQGEALPYYRKAILLFAYQRYDHLF